MDVGRWQDRVGHRVVVRHRRGGGGVTDVVGELTAVDTELHVTTRLGPVAVPIDSVVAGKVIPPKPSRRGPAHLVTSITDLQGVMSLHWRAGETERLGGWLLRASGGFTGRANSALALGDPGVDPGQALDVTVAWYRARGLPPKVQAAGHLDGGVPDDDGPATQLRSACREACWQPVPDGSAQVLTAPTAAVRGLGRLPAGLSVDLADTPDDAWLATYRYRGQQLPPVALQLLLSAPRQTFVSIRDGERTVAVARASLGGGWAGLTAMDVHPDARRRGLGTALLGVVADWAWKAGASSTFLQMAESNTAAEQLYTRAGFALHHRYDYLQPSPP